MEKKIENLLKYYTASILLLIFISCNSNTSQKKDTTVYTDALEYNEAIVDVQMEVISLMQIETGSSDEYRSMVAKLEEASIIALNKYKKISFHKDDYGMKQAFMNQMKFYQKNGVKYLGQLADVLQEMELLEEDDEGGYRTLWDEYSEITTFIATKEGEYDREVERTQNKFAEKYGFALENNIIGTEADDEFWNEIINGCEGDEHCICSWNYVRKDYIPEDIIQMNTEEILETLEEYTIYCN